MDKKKKSKKKSKKKKKDLWYQGCKDAWNTGWLYVIDSLYKAGSFFDEKTFWK